MPPAFIKLPARIKAGMASKTNELIPENMVCGIIVNGIPANKRYNSEASPKLKAIGIPIMIKTKKDPTKRIDIMVVHLLTLAK